MRSSGISGFHPVAARVRGHDVPEVRGSAERLRAATGWTPEIPLERTVADALDAWREALGATR